MSSKVQENLPSETLWIELFFLEILLPPPSLAHTQLLHHSASFVWLGEGGRQPEWWEIEPKIFWNFPGRQHSAIRECSPICCWKIFPEKPLWLPGIRIQPGSLLANAEKEKGPGLSCPNRGGTECLCPWQGRWAPWWFSASLTGVTKALSLPPSSLWLLCLIWKEGRGLW